MNEFKRIRKDWLREQQFKEKYARTLDNKITEQVQSVMWRKCGNVGTGEDGSV